MEIYGSFRDDVARIRGALGDNQAQMSHVGASLVAFQAGLLGVEKEMLPIYTLTEKLRATQKNIDLCVHELQHINKNFVVAQELAPTLAGTKFDLDEYVKALQKLLAAIAFLEGHRFYEGSAKALEQAKELLSQARKKLKAEFVGAVGVLSRGSRDGDDSVVWSKPTQKDMTRVTQLLRCLLSANMDQTDLLTEYSKQRFQVVKMFLSDESQPNSLGFDCNEPIPQLAKRLKDIETTIRAEKLLSDCIFSAEELANAAFRYASYPILLALKTDLGAPAKHQKGSKQQALFRMLLLHEILVERINDFEALLLPPLLLRDRKGVGLDDPWVLSKLLSSTVADVAQATKQNLFSFQLEMTEQLVSNDRTITRDGNVHAVSSHTLSFIRQLCEHTKQLHLLLAKDSNQTPTSFIETTVMQLVESLQSKSSQFKGRGDLKCLFLANNFSYIANSIPRCSQSGEADLDAYLQKEIKPRIEELRDKSISQFVQGSYGSFKEYLVDPKETLHYAKGGSLLTLESGRLLKEKFARFNTEIEAIHKTQRSYVVTEPNVRLQLIQEAVDAVIPQYTVFYDKYSVVHFSKKNSSKYLKYKPKAAEQLLRELFLGEVMSSESQA